MKTTQILFILVLFSLSVSCKKHKSIAYEDSATNVLSFADGSTLISGASYNMTADLGKKAELKIVITNLSSTSALWFYTNKNDWNVSTYNSGVQEFTLDEKGSSSVYMEFQPGPGSQGGAGSCRLDYYENSKAITKSKIIYW